jgi:hypothetical protein
VTATTLVVGASHSRVPVHVRERMHLAADDGPALSRLFAREGREAVVLVTHGRTELYLTGAGAIVREDSRPLSGSCPKRPAVTRGGACARSHRRSPRSATMPSRPAAACSRHATELAWLAFGECELVEAITTQP